MSILKRTKIINEIERNNIVCVPFNPNYVKVNSIDLHLDIGIYELAPNSYSERIGKMFVNPKEKPHLIEIPTYYDKDGHEYFYAYPDKCYLGMTIERVGSTVYYPRMEGCSANGRLFFSPHYTAGSGDVGFIGKWEVEITVNILQRVYIGQRIAQMTFWDASDSGCQYDGTYQGQEIVQGSNLWKKFYVHEKFKRG